MISMFPLLKTLAYHVYYMMEKIKVWVSFILYNLILIILMIFVSICLIQNEYKFAFLVPNR